MLLDALLHCWLTLEEYYVCGEHGECLLINLIRPGSMYKDLHCLMARSPIVVES
jgi:hypothetical protein